MVADAKRSKELTELIGELVRIHFKGGGTTVELGDSGAVISGCEGYVVDVGLHFIYIGENMEDGYTTVLDIDNVNMVELIDDVPPELAAVREPDEGLH